MLVIYVKLGYWATYVMRELTADQRQPNNILVVVFIAMASDLKLVHFNQEKKTTTTKMKKKMEEYILHCICTAVNTEWT